MSQLPLEGKAKGKGKDKSIFVIFFMILIIYMLHTIWNLRNLQIDAQSADCAKKLTQSEYLSTLPTLILTAL